MTTTERLKMVTIERLLYQLDRLAAKAYKKKDLNLAFKIKDIQLTHFLAMRKTAPLDLTEITTDELARALEHAKIIEKGSDGYYYKAR